MKAALPSRWLFVSGEPVQRDGRMWAHGFFLGKEGWVRGRCVPETRCRARSCPLHRLSSSHPALSRDADLGAAVGVGEQGRVVHPMQWCLVTHKTKGHAVFFPINADFPNHFFFSGIQHSHL